MYPSLKRKLIIFDLDGTLIDSSADIAWAANKTLSQMGYPEMDAAAIKKCIGRGVRSLMSLLMPSEPSERIDLARDVFLEHYGSHLTVSTTLYPGTMDTLEYLKGAGKNMAIVTNKPIGLTEAILDSLEIRDYFSAVLGGDSLLNKKPHPEPLLKILDLLQTTLEDAVFIGDSRTDIETGHAASVATIGAAYGFRGRKELEDAGCSIVIEDIAGLIRIIR
ncbi:MAG: HAD-IA family hydrolase [Deltaproteobacteria bacterium]|nr:HAD-IA family hydrolase [Deltaproteobacteria bacterium]